MPNLLAGLAALLWGSADFLGGVAVKKWSAPRFGALTQMIGLVTVLLVLAVVPSHPSAADCWWGAAAGVGTAVSLVLFFRSLAIGPMNVAAPTAAVVGAVVPVALGLVTGERPTVGALVGVVLALVAVILVAQDGSALHATREVLLLSTGAGLAIGMAISCYAQTSITSGIWPPALARLVATILLGATALMDGGRKLEGLRSNLRIPLAVGIGDTLATICLILALQRGSLVLVSVLGELFPVVTVVLARAALKERTSHLQLLGFGLAAAAVVLITVS